MGNLAITYQHIADILSFKTPTEQLEQTLSRQSFNWDAIVIEGSKHLILPAIYCRLKAKQLLHILPEELNNYLEEITSINRNRNIAILQQVHSISQLFNQHSINHVFLKGSALLVFGCFKDNAERMIGDIDVLVSTNDLEKAYNLLTKNHYVPIDQTIGHQYFEHKHLPRLKTKHEICAVEVHEKLFTSFTYNELKNNNLLNKKTNLNSIDIPSQKHLIMHNILNYQINDKGALFNSISFRSAYDTLCLLRNYVNEDVTWYSTKIFSRYFNNLSLFFKDDQITNKGNKNIFTSFYLFKLKHLRFYKFWNKILVISHFTPIFIKRFYYFIFNNSYRKAIIKDRKRVSSLFKSIFN